MKYRIIGIGLGCIILLAIAGIVYASTLFNHNAVITTTITNAVINPIEGNTFLVNNGGITNGTTYQKDAVLSFTNNSTLPVTVNITGTPYNGCTYSGPTTFTINPSSSYNATLSLNTTGLGNGTYNVPISIDATY
jgi:hypothetical protein